MSQPDVRCPLCKGTDFTYGSLSHPGLGRGSLGNPYGQRFFYARTPRYRGRAPVRAFVCTSCGYLGTYVDMEDLENMRDRGKRFYNVRDDY